MTRTRSIFSAILLTAVAGLSGCVTVPSVSPQAYFEPRGVARPLDAPLTIDAAVTHVLANDLELRAARHRISMAYWQKVQASLPANPRLAVSADPTEWAVKLSAHIADLIDLGGRREAMAAAGQSRAERAVLDVLRREIELTRQVRTDFAEVWARRQATRLMQERVDMLENFVEVARSQHDLGEIGELDAIQLERRLLDARMNLREQVLLRRQAEARLNRWLALPMTAELQLAMPSVDTTWLEVVASDEAPIDLGLLRRPELAVLATKAQEHHAMLTVARMQWLTGIEAGPYLKREDGSTFGGGEVTVVLPLFDRGQAQQGVHKSALAALEEQMLAMQATLLLEIHETVVRLRHVRQTQAVDLQAIHRQVVAERDLLLQAHKLGEISQIEARMSHLAVLDAEVAIEMGRMAEWRAQADLAAALGDRGKSTGRNDTHGEH